jgi:hypothetical protein
VKEPFPEASEEIRDAGNVRGVKSESENIHDPASA